MMSLTYDFSLALNKIGDPGVVGLADGLKANKKLAELK